MSLVLHRVILFERLAVVIQTSVTSLAEHLLDLRVSITGIVTTLTVSLLTFLRPVS